jgi:Flp pilus assembly protein TadD
MPESQIKPAPPVLQLIGGIGGAIIGTVVGRYSGLNLLIPLGFALLAGWIAWKTVADVKRPMVFAFAVQVGHGLWMASGMFLLGLLASANNMPSVRPSGPATLMLEPWLFNLLDIAILLGGLTWLLIRPGLAAVLCLSLYQAVGLGVNTAAFSGAAMGSLEHKALLVHLILRTAAIVLMYLGLYRIGKLAAANGEGEESGLSWLTCVLTAGVFLLFPVGIGLASRLEPGWYIPRVIKHSRARDQYDLGVAAAARGKLGEAINHYQKALEIDPEYAEAHNSLGVAWTEQYGHVDGAIDHYRRALEIKRDYAEAQGNLCIALAFCGQVDEAIALYRNDLEMKPDLARGHNNLGMALAARGRIDEAVSHYRKAIKAIEVQHLYDYAEPYNNLGTALAARRQFDEAITHYRRALGIRPSYGEAHNNLGLALAACGQINEAITYYEKALVFIPNDADVHNNLGEALATLGSFDEAITHYRRALKIKPNFAKARQNLDSALARKK